MYPFTFTQDKFTNNIFQTNRSKHLYKSKSFNDYDGVSVFIGSKRDHYFQKKATQIINKIANFGYLEPKLRLVPHGKNIAHFSPDIRMAQRNLFKQHDIINQVHSFDKYLPNTNDSSGDDNYFGKNSHRLLSKKAQFGSNQHKPSLGMDYNSRNLKHIVSQKNAKTPMQELQNPLKSIMMGQSNLSNREGLSDHSEDDFLFFDNW
jgi:hypothetical protein